MPNRRTTTLWAAGFALALTASGTAAASPSVELSDEWFLTVDGQYRPRVIVHTGLDFRGDDSEVRELATHRARLGLTLEHDTGVAFTLRVQDVRIWGEEDSTLDFSASGFDAHEVFAVLPIVRGLSLKIGRQEITLDNHRLVGNVGWTQRARSFDAGRLTYSAKPVTLDVFYSKILEAGQYPDGTVPDGRDGDIDFGGVHASFEISKNHQISPSFMTRWIQATDDVRHTAGVNATGKHRGFRYTGEAFYQFGTLEDETISTAFVAGELGYAFDVPKKPAIAVFLEHLHGNGSAEGTFDTLFATNHKFYGEMDFFLNIPVHTTNLGLVDLGGRLSAAIAERVGAHVDVHHFRSAEDDAAGNSVFGNEIDVKVVFDPIEFVQVRALYGIFVPDELMRTVGRAPATGSLEPDHFTYLTLDVKF